MPYLLDTDICIWVIRGRRIGEADLVIASTAIANGYTLVTGNEREFAWVPGLVQVNWVA